MGRASRTGIDSVDSASARESCPVNKSARSAVTGTLAIALALTGCTRGAPSATPPIVPGSSSTPREVNLIAKDYTFLPDTLDLVPGETVLLHVINGGLAVHEAIIGGADVQEAWEIAEAATEGAPPGPTPVVSVSPDAAGIRVVVASGERVDIVLTVPVAAEPWIVGCHIPGHIQKGMQIPVRWVDPPVS